MTTFEEFVPYWESIGSGGFSHSEAYRICESVENTKNLDGCIVEVGVYEGLSAQVIHKYSSPDKKIYLFESFSGLVDVNREYDGDYLMDGLLKFDNQILYKRFEQTENVIIVPGIFPDSGIDVLKNTKVSFVHLDVDTHQSTFNSLVFLYDKILPGGIILIHDYQNNPSTPGVKPRVDSFFSDKDDFLIVPEDDNWGPNSQIKIIKK